MDNKYNRSKGAGQMNDEQRKAMKYLLTIVAIITCIFIVVSLVANNWHYLIYSLLSSSFMIALITIILQIKGDSFGRRNEKR